jgi:translation initiation factor IF-1
MPAPDIVIERGRVVATLSAAAWWVELANGHRLVARVLRRDAGRMDRPEIGAVVGVAVSPGDLSQGVVVVEENLYNC